MGRGGESAAPATTAAPTGFVDLGDQGVTGPSSFQAPQPAASANPASAFGGDAFGGGDFGGDDEAAMLEVCACRCSHRA